LKKKAFMKTTYLKVAAMVLACKPVQGIAPERSQLPSAVSPHAPAPEKVQVLKGGALPVQSLPANYVFSFPHLTTVPDTVGGASLDVLPSAESGNGWVNPHSLSQLWVPMKMAPAPRARLALGALVKEGQLRCIFPAVDLFTTSASDDGKSPMTWRNWGLNSVPMASTWLDSDFIPLAELTISVYALDSSEEDTIDAWAPIRESFDISENVGQLIALIADPPKEFPTKGFALLTIPLVGADIPLPKRRTLTRVYLSDYPEPRKLLELRGEASGSGFMEFATTTVSSGADSAYLPEAYKPLFQPNGAGEV